MSLRKKVKKELNDKDWKRDPGKEVIPNRGPLVGSTYFNEEDVQLDELVKKLNKAFVTCVIMAMLSAMEGIVMAILWSFYHNM
ncbi:MAG: hypothetical protein PHY59_06925 [Methanobacterium sp.]|nr:hypothetical protein [Methanobacterium sp.]